MSEGIPRDEARLGVSRRTALAASILLLGAAATRARAAMTPEPLTPIPIPPQDSEIMLFAESRNGVSVPATLHVRWAGAVPAPPAASTAEFAVKPKLYVLSVGVAQYQDRALQLQYSAKDARDFANAMKLQGGRLYRDVEIRLLTDAQATRDAVVDGLEWLKTQVTYRDVGMLFLAGHGVNDPNGIYYFLPVNFSDQALMRTGVPFPTSGIRCRRSSVRRCSSSTRAIRET